MRRDIDRNMNSMDEAESIEVPVKSTMKPASKPIKIGVHVKYNGKEYLVQDLKDDDMIFIAMEDETHIVDKSDVEVIR